MSLQCICSTCRKESNILFLSGLTICVAYPAIAYSDCSLLKSVLTWFVWLNTVTIHINSVNQLIFVMVKCGVLFEVWTGFLNTIWTSFVFKGLNFNSVNQLIFVMVKCGVLFEVRTEFLNIIWTECSSYRVVMYMKLKQYRPLLNTFTGHKPDAFRLIWWPSSVIKTNTSVYGSDISRSQLVCYTSL
jgi:hypothetical protein